MANCELWKGTLAIIPLPKFAVRHPQFAIRYYPLPRAISGKRAHTMTKASRDVASQRRNTNYSIDSVSVRIRQLQDEGKTVVFTNGCFDVLHPGHLDLLTRARKLGDILVVAINSDASVRRLKGAERPIFPESERAEILTAMEAVDFVCVFDEDTPLAAILRVRPDILVKGADWTGNIVGSREVEGWGGKVVTLPLVEGQSTTGVIGRVLSSGSSE
jgi:rfaE bifunctional protein nucleotidyltransferase chain/domain